MASTLHQWLASMHLPPLSTWVRPGCSVGKEGGDRPPADLALPGPVVTIMTYLSCSTYRTDEKGTTTTPGPPTPADLHPVSLPAERVSGRCNLAPASVKSRLHFYHYWGVGDPDPTLPSLLPGTYKTGSSFPVLLPDSRTLIQKTKRELYL